MEAADADGRTAINSSPSLGRFLVASRMFEPGDIVLGPETPYSIALHDPSSRCDCCLVKATAPRRCGGCRLVHFSDANHQRHGWAAGHKHECALLGAAPGPVPSALLLAARTIRRRQQQPCAALDALMHGWDNFDSNRKVTFAQMAILVTYAHNSSTKHPTKHDAARPCQDVITRPRRCQRAAYNKCRTHAGTVSDQRPHCV